MSVALLYLRFRSRCAFSPPEQIRTPAIHQIVRKLAPERADPPGVKYVLSGQEPATPQPSAGPASLFRRPASPRHPAALDRLRGQLRWRPTSSRRGARSSSNEIGLSREMSAYGTSLNSLCGAIGGLLLMRFIDRIGAVSLALMPAIAGAASC